MLSSKEQTIVNKALRIISNHYHRENLLANNPDVVKEYCQLQIGHLDYEVFGTLFLDNQNRLIKFENIFRGTIDKSPVYPREVAKEALYCNAAAVIFTHNHPAGVVEPSLADRTITANLGVALFLFEIRVLDHIIVSEVDTFSFAEQGLL